MVMIPNAPGHPKDWGMKLAPISTTQDDRLRQAFDDQRGLSLHPRSEMLWSRAMEIANAMAAASRMNKPTPTVWVLELTDLLTELKGN